MVVELDKTISFGSNITDVGALEDAEVDMLVVDVADVVCEVVDSNPISPVTESEKYLLLYVGSDAGETKTITWYELLESTGCLSGIVTSSVSVLSRRTGMIIRPLMFEVASFFS